MKKIIYKLDALTNMHVGSGDMNFDTIDNQVQRDVLSSYPTINSSSLKGALKEHFKAKDSDKLADIFGSPEQTGKFTFFNANLLSFPVRSNKQPFFRAICPNIIDSFLKFIEDFSIDYDLTEPLNNLKEVEVEEGSPVVFKDLDNVIIEDYKAKVEKGVSGFDKLKTLFGSDIVLFTNEDFQRLVSELPVVARNKLKDGESKNLWYEEIVPRESRFYFAVLIDGQATGLAKNFNQVLQEPVQIGANSSLGYGYSNIEKIAGGNDE